MRRVLSPSNVLLDAANADARSARTGGSVESSERPRTVYLRTCARIGDRYAGQGYRYVKSAPRFTRTSGDYTYSVQFQSSQHNIAGVYIALWIHAYVTSRRLRDWRVAVGSPLGPRDFVAGGQIGNLVEPCSWLEWNLADPDWIDAEIEDAIAAIDDHAVRYFQLFEQPAQVADLIQSGAAIPGMQTADAVDYLGCFVSLDAARSYASLILTENPELVASYRGALEVDGLGPENARPLSGTGAALASQSRAYSFGDLSAT